MRVLIADPLSREAIELLSKAGHEVLESEDLEGQGLGAALRGAAAVIVRGRTRVTREALSMTRDLRVVCRAGSGVDNVDLEAAREREVAVFNTPGANAVSVAELAWGLILAVHRKLVRAACSTVDGCWEKKQFSGQEIRGRTLGVIGLGQVGREVARLGIAFGCRVLAFDPLVSVPESLPGVTACEVDELLAESDIVSLHAPLIDGTRNLLSAEKLQRMKRGAVLINTARGGIVDEAALEKLLVGGHLAGAGLDVFENEPPGERSLLALPQVVATPHIGAATAGAQARAARQAAGIVCDYLAGGSPAGRIV